MIGVGEPWYAPGRMSASSRDTLADETPLVEGASTLLGEREQGDDEGDPFGDLGPGSTVGERYLLERVLGRGSTGVVFEASHVVIGKRVALKCLHPQHATLRNVVARFFREAKIAATVEHPNVIQVFDGGRDGDVLFLAMERLEGESLGDRLDRGPLPIAQAVELFVAIMDGVAAVHERGVVHRDLKPDNIFLAKDRTGAAITPKVLDFGISKLKEPGLRELTGMNMVMGTPYYMAPEQIASARDVDARADVYSLGVMLYVALMGAGPYGNDSVLDVFRRAQSGDPRPFEAMRDEVPEGIVSVVEKAMRPEVGDRYGSVAELRDALALASIARDTDPPEDERRVTVRDLVSPVAGRERGVVVIGAPPRIEEAVTPKDVRIDAASDPARIENRSTLAMGAVDEGGSGARVPSQPPPEVIEVEHLPRWAYAALAGAAIVTLSALAIATLALML